MNSVCNKCSVKLISLKDDTLICSVCKKSLHYYCAGLTEPDFKKPNRYSKARFICCVNNQNVTTPLRNLSPTNMEKKIDDLIQSVDFIGKQFDDFNKKINSMLSEIKFLKSENEKINNENKYLLKEISMLKYKIDNIEQSKLNSCVDITGIPTTANENCIEIVKDIGIKTNSKINVLSANRIHFNNSTKSIIVAQLESTEMKKNLISNSKTHKITANSIINSWPIENKIYVNERLTKD